MAFRTYDEHDHPRMTPAVQWLIAIGVAIFFLQLTLVRPADMFGALGFELRDITERPWTIATYMFVHAGFLHLALNMYTLWLFGPRIEHSWSRGSFVFYFLLCGIGGWLFHVLFVRDGILVGASAAVLGVMLAYAMRWPDDEVLFFFVPMKVKWMVFFLGAMNLLMAASATAGGPAGRTAWFAHLGGLAFGFMYLRTSSAGGIDRLRQRMSQIPDTPDDETPRAIPPRPHPRHRDRDREPPSEADEIVARSNALISHRPAATAGSRAPTPTPAPPPSATAEALDRVLDKISEQGLESLTSEERRLLDEMSKRLRTGDQGV